MKSLLRRPDPVPPASDPRPRRPGRRQALAHCFLSPACPPLTTGWERTGGHLIRRVNGWPPSTGICIYSPEVRPFPKSVSQYSGWDLRQVAASEGGALLVGSAHMHLAPGWEDRRPWGRASAYCLSSPTVGRRLCTHLPLL